MKNSSREHRQLWQGTFSGVSIFGAGCPRTQAPGPLLKPSPVIFHKLRVTTPDPYLAPVSSANNNPQPPTLPQTSLSETSCPVPPHPTPTLPYPPLPRIRQREPSACHRITDAASCSQSDIHFKPNGGSLPINSPSFPPPVGNFSDHRTYVVSGSEACRQVRGGSRGEERV